jgi:ADP-ribose pyrophosphatase YjhB (NUDIX family)
MAMAAPSFKPQSLQRATITAGGILWRRAESGRIEVCLSSADGTFGSSFSIPRGAVLEDERVEDAAVRRVYEATGVCGRAPRRLGRLCFSSGEIAYIHLLRAPRTGTPKDSAWVPIASAPRLVETDGEREVLMRIAALFASITRVPESGRYVVSEEVAARRSTSASARKRSRVPASAA